MSIDVASPTAHAVSRHMYGLDIIRIVAATTVLLDHFANFSSKTADPFAKGDAIAFPILAPFSGMGAIGVQIFFVISGFVIALSTTNTRAIDFAKHRIIRLAPALWICAAITLGVRYLYGDSLGELVPSFFRSVFLSPIGPYIDGVVWTLVVEAVFYATVFAVMLTGTRITLEMLAIALGTVSSIYLIALGWSAVQAAGGDTALFDILGRFPFKVFLLRHGVFFAIGILIFSMHRNGMRRWKLLAAIAFGLFGLIEIAVAMKDPAQRLPGILYWLVGISAIAASIYYAPAIAARADPYKWTVRMLGKLSYPLYLNHFAFGTVLVPSLFAAGFPTSAALVAGISLIFAVALIITLYLEPKGQQVLRRILSPQRSATAAAN